jgi:hypothetical protein
LILSLSELDHWYLITYFIRSEDNPSDDCTRASPPKDFGRKTVGGSPIFFLPSYPSYFHVQVKDRSRRKSVPLWAWFSASDAGDFVRIHGKFTSEKYLEILGDILFC